MQNLKTVRLSILRTAACATSLSVLMKYPKRYNTVSYTTIALFLQAVLQQISLCDGFFKNFP
jgi:hypothetical protein